MKLLYPLLAALLLSLSPVAGAQSLGQVDSIVAVVDEDVILRSELDRAVANVYSQYAGQQAQLPPRNVLERQVLERLVVMRLQLERARASGVRVGDAELEQSVQMVAAQNQMSPAQLRAQLAAQNIPFEEFRNQLRDEMIVQRLQQRISQSRVAVSESEIDMVLAGQGDQDNTLYRIANILVALPEAPSREQLELAQTKINGIKDLIDRGEMTFAAAAIRYSDFGNALEGGEIGWRSLDEIPNLFSGVVRGMSAGQTSQPIRGPSGLQLIHVSETRQADRQTVQEFRARHLMVQINELVSEPQARQRVEDYRRRVEAGEDFATLARQYSDDASTKQQGGDMGWFQRDVWGSAVAQQIEMLSDGELSQPFRTEAAWHVLQRIDSRTTDVTEANRRAQARETIARRKSEEELERYIRQLRSEAFIELRLGTT